MNLPWETGCIDTKYCSHWVLLWTLLKWQLFCLTDHKSNAQKMPFGKFRWWGLLPPYEYNRMEVLLLETPSSPLYPISCCRAPVVVNSEPVVSALKYSVELYTSADSGTETQNSWYRTFGGGSEAAVWHFTLSSNNIRALPYLTRLIQPNRTKL